MAKKYYKKGRDVLATKAVDFIPQTVTKDDLETIKKYQANLVLFFEKETNRSTNLRKRVGLLNETMDCNDFIKTNKNAK